MNDKANIVMNWSSGKDAALAYHTLIKQGNFDIKYLLTTISEEHNRIFMHGIREQLLDIQAERMKKPLIKIKLPASPDDTVYKEAMKKTLTAMTAEGIHIAAYGDIFLEDLKIYREQQLAQVGMTGLFLLWKKDTRELVTLVEQAGIEAILVCVNDKYLGKEFLGRKINAEFLNDLPASVDPCGENGEFHTFVYNAPFFTSPIPVKAGEIVYKTYSPSQDDSKGWNTGFYFLDVNIL
jgi:uncharacterized protein (TIGR00290 family)